MNTIIAIGWTSSYRCYLNLSKEEAIEKYMKEHNVSEYTLEELRGMIKEINFNDSFSVYDIWCEE
jgi:hypothetical protein